MVCEENHVIDWDNANIVSKERDVRARGIKEALFMSKAGYH